MYWHLPSLWWGTPGKWHVSKVRSRVPRGCMGKGKTPRVTYTKLLSRCLSHLRESQFILDMKDLSESPDKGMIHSGEQISHETHTSLSSLKQLSTWLLLSALVGTNHIQTLAPSLRKSQCPLCAQYLPVAWRVLDQECDLHKLHHISFHLPTHLWDRCNMDSSSWRFCGERIKTNDPEVVLFIGVTECSIVAPIALTWGC